MPRILGISASLRNARLGIGSAALVIELSQCGDLDALRAYISKHISLRADEFFEAGRKDDKPFDEIFGALRSKARSQGLSNSEAAVAVALWGAKEEGAEIAHISLAEFFSPTGGVMNEARLRSELLSADAVIISGPVYFGDRGSLAQSFVEYVQADREVSAALEGRLYAGLAVGAKRNGGQETTLIYQMLDMVNLNMLAVGNSSESTSQYGGTAVAGDIGKFIDDDYGFNTCLGTGQRVARVSRSLVSGSATQLEGPIDVHLWLLQDDGIGTGHALLRDWCDRMQERHNTRFTLWNMTRERIDRCIACDLCPIVVGPPDEYRCIIKAKRDFFVQHHKELIKADAVLMCAFSPTERADVVSNYQQFIERTRYIRRDNYLLSDRLFAPFVISELNARQNLHLRMLTSGIRHHTVLHHPLIGMIEDGKLLSEDALLRQSDSFLTQARRLVAGQMAGELQQSTVYEPHGYTISKEYVERERQSGRLEKHMHEAKSGAQARRRGNLQVQRDR